MPRASAAVAEQPDEDFAPEGFTPPGQAKKKTRTEKPIYVLYRVVDADGNELPGAELQVALVTKDSHTVAQTLSREKLAMQCLEVSK